jgi:hypothetical protein
LLADTHISADPAAQYGGVRTATSAAQAVQQVKDCDIAGTIISGDVAWMHGLPQDYAAAQTRGRSG